jgi:hypothetical protein
MARSSPDRSRTRISGVFRRHASYHSGPKILVTKSARKIEFELSNPISQIVRRNFRFWGIQSGVATSILGAKQKQQAENGRPLLPERDVEADRCWNHPGQLLTDPERSYDAARPPGLIAGRRAGSKGDRSIQISTATYFVIWARSSTITNRSCLSVSGPTTSRNPGKRSA